jgi:hypothetical protein
MSEKTKQALKVLEAALLLGVLGDGLLRATPWGLNILLGAGAIVAAIGVLLGQRRRRALSGGGHFLLVAFILFAASFAWRDSLTLNVLAAIALVITLALMAWRARAGRIWLASLTEYALAIGVAGVNALFIGFPGLLSDISVRKVAPAGWSRHLKHVVRGVLITLPLLVLFGGLLMSADAAFERMIEGVFLRDHQEVLGHIFLALGLAWIAGGFLRGLLLGREVKIVDGRASMASPAQAESVVVETLGASVVATQPLKTEPPRLGIVEVGITLGLLNVLFLSFVLIQLRYFFGGMSLVQDSDGLTFAEYYRRGFFELVTVAALVLPILLIMHWLLRKGNPAHERIFRLLAGAQVFLLFVMMASAVRRMMLYQTVYGLTELRLYTTAFIVWLALVFIWFSVTALRGRRERFASGALIAGLLVIGTLHIINPDALIVRVNLTHARAGGNFDAQYAATLSADAAPALMESLPSLHESDRRIVAANILDDLASHEGTDWRSWNWSRAERRRVVNENRDTLRAMATPSNIISVVDTTPPPPQAISAQSVDVAKPTKLPATKPENLAPVQKQVKPFPRRAVLRGKRR